MNKRWIAIVLLLVLSVTALTGCFGKDNASEKAVEEAALNYIKAVGTQNWDEVLKRSTGDQLSLYMQLVPSLKLAKQESELKKSEIVDKAVLDNGLAFVTTRMVRSIKLPNVGAVMDDRQVLLSMKNLDGVWKVFRMDVVVDSKVPTK